MPGGRNQSVGARINLTRASEYNDLSGQRFCFVIRLERDEAVKPIVLGFIDNSHTPATESLKNEVMRDGLPDERVGSRHSAVILGCFSEASRRTAPTRATPNRQFTGEELQLKFSDDFC